MSYLVYFQPREVSKSIPFSSNKLLKIFSTLSIKPGSQEAKIIIETLEICERPRIKREDNLCATFLESMIDFTISKLDNSPQAILKELENQHFDKLEQYKIVVTSAYKVLLIEINGGSTMEVNGLAVCHKDTPGWNPNHLAFQLKSLKPGDRNSICYILEEGNIV
ncbi:hypothetical protein ACFE04_018107 [Oxalis oulophora]